MSQNLYIFAIEQIITPEYNFQFFMKWHCHCPTPLTNKPTCILVCLYTGILSHLQTSLSLNHSSPVKQVGYLIRTTCTLYSYFLPFISTSRICRYFGIYVCIYYGTCKHCCLCMVELHGKILQYPVRRPQLTPFV